MSAWPRSTTAKGSGEEERNKITFSNVTTSEEEKEEEEKG